MKKLFYLLMSAALLVIPVHAMKNHDLQKAVSKALESAVERLAEEALPLLISAIQNGQTHIVRELISQMTFSDQVINRETTTGITPLHAAACVDNEEIALLLIQAQAQINLKTAVNGFTPLHIAAGFGSVRVASLLIAHEADVNIHDAKGATPLTFAIHGGKTRIIELLLLNKAIVDAKEEGGQPALYAAAFNGDVNSVKILLNAGVLIDKPASGEATPLMAASKKGHDEVVRLLIASGASINAQATNGFTALASAAQEGRLSTVKILLAAGADFTKSRPLHVAVVGKHIEVIQELLAAGIDVNATDDNLQTALLFAINMQEKEITKLLLKHKADTEKASNLGINALEIASKNDDKKMMKTLLVAGAHPEAVSAASRAAVEAVQTKIACANCKKPSRSKCGRCKTAYYCSQDCQRSHWPMHKNRCLAQA